LTVSYDSFVKSVISAKDNCKDCEFTQIELEAIKNAEMMIEAGYELKLILRPKKGSGFTWIKKGSPLL